MNYIFCGQSYDKFLSTLPSSFKSNSHYLHLPLIKKQSCPAFLPKEKNYDFTAVVSQAVVEYFPKGKNIRSKHWFGVGPETAKIVKEKWSIPKVNIPKTYNASSLADSIMQSGTHDKENSILWLGAREGITTGIEKLRQAGFRVEVITPYQSKITDINNLLNTWSSAWEKKNITLDDFLNQKAVWIFTSPMTVHSYFKQNLHRKSHKIACLGPATASIFLQKGITPDHVAEKSTLQTLTHGLFSNQYESKLQKK